MFEFSRHDQVEHVDRVGAHDLADPFINGMDERVGTFYVLVIKQPWAFVIRRALVRHLESVELFKHFVMGDKKLGRNGVGRHDERGLGEVLEVLWEVHTCMPVSCGAGLDLASKYRRQTVDERR